LLALLMLRRQRLRWSSLGARSAQPSPALRARRLNCSCWLRARTCAAGRVRGGL
jgi:hypothetical protein